MDVMPKIQMTTSDWEILRDLLQRHISGVRVWAFGSRVTGTARPSSDLDLVAFAPASDAPRLADLRDALAQSNITFPVDLHRHADLPPDFHAVIEKHYIEIQTPATANSPL